MSKQENNMILYLRVTWPYIAIKTECGILSNIGAIEKRHQGGGFPGTLNVKPELDRLLMGGCSGHPGFNQVAGSGALRRGAGTGYIGWVDFGQIGHAVGFLRRYCKVVFCPTGGHIELAGGTLVPIPLVNGSKYWERLRTVLERAINEGRRPSRLVFRGGGLAPIPLWFRQWCLENNVEIEIIDSDDYDLRFSPQQSWVDEESNSIT